ncbi:unnamed protein product [Nesidiocoris tenuis]|uniref:Uncharacterized protein n=1 Tax=Nesidiocoris tenuis TaxID=355587 RepID=A0A6H5HA78_9HEMI|nr:unnamed protein product [Nesidiocoris tenuis]
MLFPHIRDTGKRVIAAAGPPGGSRGPIGGQGGGNSAGGPYPSASHTSGTVCAEAHVFPHVHALVAITTYAPVLTPPNHLLSPILLVRIPATRRWASSFGSASNRISRDRTTIKEPASRLCKTPNPQTQKSAAPDSLDFSFEAPLRLPVKAEAPSPASRLLNSSHTDIYHNLSLAERVHTSRKFDNVNTKGKAGAIRGAYRNFGDRKAEFTMDNLQSRLENWTVADNRKRTCIIFLDIRKNQDPIQNNKTTASANASRSAIQ